MSPSVTTTEAELEGDASEGREPWLHRLPPATAVDRVSFLERLATGRRVIHLGFGDGAREVPGHPEIWLHRGLGVVARELIGIDLDEHAVRRAKSNGYVAHVADCTERGALKALGVAPAELVVAGELIEHLDDPAGFLDEVHSVVASDGRLVLTTPNATSLLTFVAAAGRGLEFVNADHVALYTWYTLSNLLRRHGWAVEEFLTYRYPGRAACTSQYAGGAVRIRRSELRAWQFLTQVERLLVRWRPFLASGLIVVAKPAG